MAPGGPDRDESALDSAATDVRPGASDAGHVVGRFVRARRRARGLTQQELAELAGVGTRFVSELERGKRTVRLDETDRVLAVFGKRLGVVDRDPAPGAP